MNIVGMKLEITDIILLTVVFIGRLLTYKLDVPIFIQKQKRDIKWLIDEFFKLTANERAYAHPYFGVSK